MRVFPALTDVFPRRRASGLFARRESCVARTPRLALSWIRRSRRTLLRTLACARRGTRCSRGGLARDPAETSRAARRSAIRCSSSLALRLVCGVSCAHDRASFEAALASAFAEDTKGPPRREFPGREVEVAVFPARRLADVSGCGEIDRTALSTLRDKYINDRASYSSRAHIRGTDARSEKPPPPRSRRSAAAGCRGRTFSSRRRGRSYSTRLTHCPASRKSVCTRS